MKYKLIIIVFLFIVSLQAQSKTDSLLMNKLQPNSEHPLHSISVYLENIKTDKLYEKAVGNHLDGKLISTKDAFKIASSTKLFVAALIMQLQEAHKLHVKDSLSEYLKLDALLLFEDKDYTSQITIEQLLNHRSGLANVFTDKKDEFATLVFQDPQKQYSPKAIVDLFYELKLPQEAHFKPGEGWYYSDMNYVLLGLLIEVIEKQPLATVLRKRILEPLNMKDTYFEYYEPSTTTKPRIAQFVTAYNFNTINTSFDWAGGGLVSSHQDLAKFMKGLFLEQLISEQSLEAMLAVQPTSENGLPYGYGVYETVLNGYKFYGHYGFYGTYVGYSPDSDTLVSYCFSQSAVSFYKDAVVNQIISGFQTVD